MSRVALVAVALLFSLRARANPPGVSILLQSVPADALAAPARQTCAPPALQPIGWVDASDALALETHPTARLDANEQHSITLSSLLQLRLDFGSVTLFLFGAPVRAGELLTLGTAGWRARWPFC